MNIGFALSAFVAGLLTFLAPCTLPLVPGYLGFISGVTQREFADAATAHRVRRRVLMNALSYVLGFSLVFMLFGTIFGVGTALAGLPRIWLARGGGLFVILFGLLMLGATRFRIFAPLAVERRLPVSRRFVHPGEPASSFLFGAVFALGWTPCIGPILGAILTLAAASATAGQGAFLLGVYSLGLAIPFLAVAFAVGTAARFLASFARFLPYISLLGALLIIALGVMILTDSMAAWDVFAYRLFNVFDYRGLLDYL